MDPPLSSPTSSEGVRSRHDSWKGRSSLIASGHRDVGGRNADAEKDRIRLVVVCQGQCTAVAGGQVADAAGWVTLRRHVDGAIVPHGIQDAGASGAGNVTAVGTSNGQSQFSVRGGVGIAVPGPIAAAVVATRKILREHANRDERKGDHQDRLTRSLFDWDPFQ